ncbi:hypothetical protein OU994_00390 [Pseudoduganella sp. SL102]|uniref:hypothetical protein n=1 Tax=Pseudoduganella sp. SL102 TaxID=2995154 RepID=UPI00248B6B50|nr:hypothetical protein [Pseudoduganella sp. SL102]WBS02799.1 hypothetical protein OU994_00390 [Pseudoduganella sp. SL102]
MQEKKVTVLFTGQLRDKALFERSLAELSAQPCVTDMVFSTWVDTALEHSEYLKSLAASYQLRVVTTVDPRLACDRFNGFRQSMTLRRGLEAATGTGHVFKTRTDCHIDADVVTFLARKDSRITESQGIHLRVFREKVSVLSSSMLAPFYIDDKLLFGHRQDLLKLCSLDFGEYRFPASGKSAHYLRFYPPFQPHFPQFMHFVRHEIFATAVSQAVRNLVMPLLVERREYALLLALYYRILSAFFCLDWGGHNCTFQGVKAECWGENPGFLLDADQHNCSNAFFARASRGDFDDAEWRRLVGEAGETIQFAGDLRDATNGVDYAAFFADVARQAKVKLNFRQRIDEAKELMKAPATLPEALNRLGGLLPCEPDHAELLYLIALCYKAARNFDLAVRYLEFSLDSGAAHDSPVGHLLAEVRREQAASRQD